jgi:hypothetical protein
MTWCGNLEDKTSLNQVNRSIVITILLAPGTLAGCGLVPYVCVHHAAAVPYDAAAAPPKIINHQVDA